MKIREALKATRHRWRHPGLWLGALVVPLFVFAPAMVAQRSQVPSDFPLLATTVAICLQWFFSTMLLGLPWQWSGDAQPQTGFLRGLLQWTVLEGLILLPTTLSPVLWLPWKAYATFLITHLAWFTATSWLLAIISWLVARGETHESELVVTEQQAFAAESLLQRASFSPVVLFQSLERLRHLEDPIRLERGLVDLAVLFRTWLAHQDRSQVTFGEERELAERYLQVLDGDDLPIRASWDPEADRRRIPPFGLSQLLETILRATPPEAPSRLSLASRALPGGLELSIEVESAVPGLGTTLSQSPAWIGIETRLSPWGLREPRIALREQGDRLSLQFTLAEVQP